MPWSFGSVGRPLIAPERGLGNEGKENVTGTHLEENVTAWFLGNQHQAQDRPVEDFSFVQVANVNGRLDDCLDGQDCLHPGWSLRPLLIQFAQLPCPQRQPEDGQEQKPHNQLE